jgi:hypothetical protein
MQTLPERLELIERHIVRAVEALEKDAGASPVLKAVVAEFQKKSAKSRAALEAGKQPREAVVELEQAADSARVAATADPGVSEGARKLVGLAHDAICLLKAEG